MLVETLRIAMSQRPASESRQALLIRHLRTAILEGQLHAGDRLPASRELATRLTLARNTVLRAYEILLAEGFLESDRRGTRVAALPSAAPANDSPTAPSGFLSLRSQQLPQREGDPLLPFAPGVPDLNAFPWPAWRRHLQNAWGEVGTRQLVQAPPGGEPALRHAVAQFLRLRRGVSCHAEQVFIVAGGHVALDACARLLADAGDTAWVENPGYPTASNAFRAANLNVDAIDVDAHGLIVDETRWRKVPPRLVYLTPAHQYPLGCVLSLERRLSLLRLAEPGRNWLIEDDYDSEFVHRRGRPPALQGLLADAPVVYLGTFSKLLYPGLRVAYMVVPRWASDEFGRRLEALYRGGHAVEQRAIARFLDSGRVLRHLQAMAPVYANRQRILRQALLEHYGHDAALTGGEAGLHLCLHLPEAKDRALVAEAAQQGVIARALSTYAAPGGQARHGLVLGYGMADATRIPELVGRLPRPGKLADRLR